MTIVHHMLSSYLTIRVPECRCCTWPCLYFQSQWHRSPSHQIVHEYRAVILVVTLAFAFDTPQLFARLWSGRPFLLQIYISKHRFWSYEWICWTPNPGSCIGVSCNLIVVSNASAWVEIFCCDSAVLRCGVKDATNHA